MAWLSAARPTLALSAAREWNEQLLAAIRLNVPNPPAHARNLFHTAVAMYNAWSAYDSATVGYLLNEKITPLPSDIEAARHEAISYAAYRVLRSRFATGTNSATILANLDAKLTALGYSTSTGQSATSSATTPTELGKRCGQAVLNWSTSDGFSQTGYPQAYTASVNSNINAPLSVLGTNANFVSNSPLGFGIPAGTNPNLWQPLDLATSVTQNGIPIPGGSQSFIGVQSLATVPFSLTRSDPVKPWLDPFGGPSRLSVTGSPSATDAAYKSAALGVLIASSQLNDNTLVSISPGAIGNNPLGSDAGTGFATNPVAGGSYAANNVKLGDFARVLAEFWADGPNSETPPGHWHVLANQVADNPATVKRIRGTGPVVNDLEWDVKVYFALSAATHDAACAAWALKRYYSGPRPITMIRYMGSKGQSSIVGGQSYHSEGLPLMTDVCEVITSATAAVGGKHRNIFDLNTGTTSLGTNFIGQIAVFSWPGEHNNNLPAPSIATNQSHVTWMLAKDWLPFQRKTFNTPAFPGYVSGHSTFSRAAAEVLSLITGSPYFPGGFHHHTFAANSMQIDKGPSEAIDLQWCSFYDAADQAGQSRRYGGIHPSEDDFHGRHIGSQAGQSAFALAEKYWNGSIMSENLAPTMILGSNSATCTWTGVRGMYQKVQCSTDLTNWTDATTATLNFGTACTYTDNSPDPVKKFYRVVWSPSP
ncbi:MAG: vanadium-dependent haloperoxidase [Prosthecobacter sp.]